MGVFGLFGKLKFELKFIYWTTSYHQARLVFRLYPRIISLFCHIDEFALNRLSLDSSSGFGVPSFKSFC